MRRRVLATGIRLHPGNADDWNLVGEALEQVGTLRSAQLIDAHDPRLLHPGRTALILLQDVGIRDPQVVALGALAESVDGELRVPDGSWHDRIPHLSALRALETLESAPLAEPAPPKEVRAALRSLPLSVRQVWLSERLDHLRHAHLLADARLRTHLAARALEVELPAAPQIHPVLARRVAWWCRRVAPGMLGSDASQRG